MGGVDAAEHPEPTDLGAPALGGVSVSPGEGARQPSGPPQKSQVKQRHTAGRAETVLSGQPGAYSLRGDRLETQTFEGQF